MRPCASRKSRNVWADEGYPASSSADAFPVRQESRGGRGCYNVNSTRGQPADAKPGRHFRKGQDAAAHFQSPLRWSFRKAFSPRQQLQALYFQSLLRLSSSRHWLTPVILVGAPYRTPGRMSSGRRWSRWSVSSRGRGRRLSLSKSWPFLNLKHELAGPTTAASRLLSPKGVRALGFLMSPGTWNKVSLHGTGNPSRMRPVSKPPSINGYFRPLVTCHYIRKC